MQVGSGWERSAEVATPANPKNPDWEFPDGGHIDITVAQQGQVAVLTKAAHIIPFSLQSNQDNKSKVCPLTYHHTPCIDGVPAV